MAIPSHYAWIASRGGKLQGWWFNPRTGKKAGSIGEVAAVGMKEFQPPGAEDWLLVLERLP